MTARRAAPFLALQRLLVLGLPGVILATGSVAVASGGAEHAATERARATASSNDLYVSPTGSDVNSGRSRTKPLRTIQAALEVAQAGTTVHLAAGNYREEPRTVRDGTAAMPITIRGPGTGLDPKQRGLAVLQGASRILNVDNSHYRLEGFTIDGQPALAGVSFPANLSDARSFKDGLQSRVVGSKLVYVGSADSVRGVNDVVVRNMVLRRAGGECLRVRDDAHDVTVSGSLIEWCGLQGTGDDMTSYRYHNGEGVYIGTSPKSTDQPLAGHDRTNRVRVSGNTIRTFGSECVDVKEQANRNSIVGNLCADDDEPSNFNGSLIELRGYDNSVESNTISDSHGYGVKISSDDQSRYAITGNVVRENGFARLAASPLRASVSLPPGDLCGNSYDGTVDTSVLAELVAACPVSSARAR